MGKRNLLKTAVLAIAAVATIGTSASAQADSTKSKVAMDAGIDLYTNYVWRGALLDQGANGQPWMTLTYGGLEVGAWGAYSLSSNGYQEADLYVTYGFDFGLSVGVTDYYVPGNNWMKFDSLTPHIMEANVGYEYGKFSLSANYTFFGADGTVDGDKYFELGYDFGIGSAFIGAGDKLYGQPDISAKDADFDPETIGDFTVVNLGVTVAKDIEVTDKFTLPLSGSVIINPAAKDIFFTVGISL